MSIAESFYTVISGNTTITDALASVNAIFPQMLPQAHAAFPAITYSQDGEEDQYMLDGNPNELKQALFSVDCYSDNYITVHNLADIVKTQLLAATGTFDSHTAEHIRKERELDIYESATELHRVSLQFLIAYF